MKPLSTASLLVALLLATPGCRRTEAKKDVLPPPTGSALPPPAIPKLDDRGASKDGAESPSKRADGAYAGTGTLHPLEEAMLGSKTTGTLRAIYVDEGDAVKKGQVLFRLDSSQAGLAVKQAEAALASAKVALGAAKLDFERTKELHERGSVAPAVYDQVKARYDGALAGVEQAKVALSMARRASADATVRSPISGVVVKKLKNVGETATLVPPTVVLVVQQVSKLELRARFPERALGALGDGTKIHATFPAVGEERDLTVERINPTVDARTRTIEVVARVDNASGTLKPGMLAEVSFPKSPPPAPPAPAGSGRPAP